LASARQAQTVAERLRNQGAEPQWQHVDDVLAAFVPDFARAEGTEGQRREMIDEVVEALLVVHGRAASLVQSWTQKHRYELERRRGGHDQGI